MANSNRTERRWVDKRKPPLITAREIAIAVGAFFVVFLGGLAIFNWMQGHAAAQPTTPNQVAHVRVVDGDTIEDRDTRIVYRLENIDTPEVGRRARCSAEREAGERASQEARSIFGSARVVEVRPIGRLDRYGRTVAFVVVDGRDFGSIMMQRGLARPWRGHREPWCGADGSLLPAR